MRGETGAGSLEPGAAGGERGSSRPGTSRLTALGSRLTALGSRLGTTIRQLTGMPDYQAYLAHRRRCHPGEPVLTERDFFHEHLHARYADGPTRCC